MRATDRLELFTNMDRLQVEATIILLIWMGSSWASNATLRVSVLAGYLFFRWLLTPKSDVIALPNTPDPTVTILMECKHCHTMQSTACGKPRTGNNFNDPNCG